MDANTTSVDVDKLLNDIIEANQSNASAPMAQPMYSNANLNSLLQSVTASSGGQAALATSDDTAQATTPMLQQVSGPSRPLSTAQSAPPTPQVPDTPLLDRTAVREVTTFKSEPTAVNTSLNTTPNGRTSLGQVTIFFNHPDTEEEDMIQSRLVAKIPAAVLDRMKQSAELFEQGSRGILYMGASSYHTLTRLKQYLDHNDYMPHNPKTPLTVVDEAGNEREWRRGMRATKTTTKTHELFWFELIFYRRAAHFGYDEVRDISSQKIRSAYPVYLQEVVLMLELLYQPASEAKDTSLLSFIEARTRHFADEIVALPKFQELLASSINEDSAGRLLLDLWMSNGKPRLELSTKSSDVHGAKGKQLQTPSSATQTPQDFMSFERISSDHDSSSAGILRQIGAAIMDGRLLVAKDDGFGTLIDGTNKRNKNFTFQASELLLADFDMPQTRHNIVVINSRGERGDLLASLVDRVSGNSISPRGQWVHLGRPEEHRDREQRQHAGNRRRSRSPARRGSHHHRRN